MGDLISLYTFLCMSKMFLKQYNLPNMKKAKIKYQILLKLINKLTIIKLNI